MLVVMIKLSVTEQSLINMRNELYSMPTIKQKTIGGSTYELKQDKTSRSGKQYEYYVTEDGQMIDDPVYTREAGMREFRETVDAIRRAEGNDRSESRGPSLPDLGGGSGGEPSIPQFGPDVNEDDDDEPGLPFF